MMRTVVVLLQTVGVAGLALFLLLSGCTTARRTTDLVVEHHVGMMRQVGEVIPGEAEQREKRLDELLDKLSQDREALERETDSGALAKHLRDHVKLQDELIAELMAGHQQGFHKCCHGGHATSAEEEIEPAESAGEMSSLIWKASTAKDHKRIAAYYRREEKKSLAEAAKHADLAQSYRSLAPAIDASEQAEHCEQLVRSLRETAKGYDALATYHENLADKLLRRSQ